MQGKDRIQYASTANAPKMEKTPSRLESLQNELCQLSIFAALVRDEIKARCAMIVGDNSPDEEEQLEERRPVVVPNLVDNMLDNLQSIRADIQAMRMAVQSL